MKLRTLIPGLLLVLLTASCSGNPEEKIESSLKAIQATLPKEIGNHVIYNKALYEKDAKTIVFGYVVEDLEEPFPEPVITAMKQTVIASLGEPSVAADPIWRLAARAGATFRYEYTLSSGAPASTFTLSPAEYRR